MSKRLLTIWLTGLLSVLSTYADVVVDTFTIDQVMNGVGTENTVFDFSMGSILSRERDAADESEFAQAQVIGGELVITGAPSAVVSLVLQWDGFDADNVLLNQGGIIPAADLTEGGENNILEFGFNRLTLGIEAIRIEVAVFSGAGNLSVADVYISEDIAGTKSIVIPFAEFVTLLGTGADFSSISAMEIFIETPQEFQERPQAQGSGVRARGPLDNIDFALNFIQVAAGVDADVTATMVDTLINESIVDGIANPGETIRYTVTITNAGPDEVSASTLANLLPPGLTFVPGSIMTSPIARDDLFATPPASSVNISAPGVLRNDNDPDGDALVIDSFDPVTAFGDSITLAPDGSFSYTPTMTSGTDTFAYAISDGVFTNDAIVSIVIDAVAELSVSMSDDVDPTAPGLNVTYTSVVTNSGPSDAINVQIRHTFPAGISFLMASPGPGITCNSPSPGVVICDIPSLAVGATGTVSLFTEASGSGFNTSRVEVTTTTFENDPSDNTDEEVTFINSPPFAADTAQVPVFGNTLRSVPAPGLLNGAFDPEGQPISLLTTTTNSLHGGSVTIQPDGAFDYIPAAGFRGPTDTFDFVISDGLHTDTGSVGLSISNMIWYVDNSQATNGDGTSVNPFNTIVDLSPSGTAALSGPDTAGDIIFLFAGSGPYTGPLLLDDQQILTGQGIDLVVAGSNLVSATSRPAFADEIALSADNQLQGFDLGSSYGLSGGSSSLTINNMNVDGSGEIRLGGGGSLALDVSLDNLVSTNGGLSLSFVTGQFDVAGETRVIDPIGPGIMVSNTTLAANFGDTLVNAGGAGLAQGVELIQNTGTNTFNSLNIVTLNGTGLQAVDGGTVDILTQTSTIDAVGGAAAIIRNTKGLSNGVSGWTFDTLLSTGSGGEGLVLESLSDTFTASGPVVIDTPSGSGIHISQSPGLNFSFSGITMRTGASSGLVVETSTGSNLDIGMLVATDMNGTAVNISDLNNLVITNPGFANFIQSLDAAVVNLTDIGNANINFGDVIANNSAGPGVVMNTVAGNTTYGFLEVFADAGDGVILQNAGKVFVSDAFSLVSATGGRAMNFHTVNVTMDLGTVIANSGVNGISLVNVSGVINIFDDTMIFGTTGSGIDIENSPAGTFIFGHMDIDTSINNTTGLRADAGGSIGNNLTGASTIDAGNARTVDITGTDMNLVFGSLQSIGGTAPGIDLQQTTGSFTVNGDGVNAARGGNGSGGQINNKALDAVVLSQVENVTLRRMTFDNATLTPLRLLDASNTVLEFCSVDNSGSHGITGTGNNALTIRGCTFDGNGTVVGDHAINLVATLPNAGLTGTLSITDTLLVNYPEHGVAVHNFSGVLDASIDGCTINNNSDVFGSDALSFISSGSARIDLDVQNTTFDRTEGAIVYFEADGTNANDINLIGNRSTTGGGLTAPIRGGGIFLQLANGGDLTFDIQRNTLTGLPADGIRIDGVGSAEGRIGGTQLVDGNTLLVRNDAAVSAKGSILLTKGGTPGTPATNGDAWTILVQNNHLGSAPGLPASGGTGHGVQLSHADDNGQVNLTLQDNRFEHVGGEAIHILSENTSPGAAPSSNIRVVNNIFDDLANRAALVDTDDNAFVCIHTQGNEDPAGSSPGTFDLDQNGVSSLQISQEDLDAMAAANNTATVLTTGTITFSGNCSSPTLPTNP